MDIACVSGRSSSDFLFQIHDGAPMRNGGLSEARCQNEVSESKAAAASSMTSKVRRSRRVTVFSNQSGMPLGGNKIDNGRRGPIAASRLFDNGSVFGVRGRRSATPLFCAPPRG